jgi:hypothetical protein
MRIALIVLIFGLPFVTAAIASGSAWKKLIWYVGTMILAIFALLAVPVVYAGGSGSHTLAMAICALSVNVLMIAVAASGGRKSK